MASPALPFRTFRVSRLAPDTTVEGLGRTIAEGVSGHQLQHLSLARSPLSEHFKVATVTFGIKTAEQPLQAPSTFGATILSSFASPAPSKGKASPGLDGLLQKVLCDDAPEVPPLSRISIDEEFDGLTPLSDPESAVGRDGPSIVE